MVSAYVVVSAGETTTDPFGGTIPTPWSMVADVPPTLDQRRVLDCPVTIAAGLAVKDVITGVPA
jgi:hypothetical protein